MTNILKRKIPQCVWLFFVFMAVLNGCGNADQKNGRETAMAEQNQKKAFTDVGTEENPETEETKIREQDTEDSETEKDGEAEKEEIIDDDDGVEIISFYCR